MAKVVLFVVYVGGFYVQAGVREPAASCLEPCVGPGPGAQGEARRGPEPRVGPKPGAHGGAARLGPGAARGAEARGARWGGLPGAVRGAGARGAQRGGAMSAWRLAASPSSRRRVRPPPWPRATRGGSPSRPADARSCTWLGRAARRARTDGTRCVRCAGGGTRPRARASRRGGGGRGRGRRGPRRW